METSSLVIFHVQDFKKEKQITKLCSQLGLRTRKLNQNDINQKVGVLAGMKEQKGTRDGMGMKAPAGYQLPEVMIFSGVPDSVLDQFLMEYKKAGTAPVALKAIVTPYNITWTLYELIGELVRERAAIILGKK